MQTYPQRFVDYIPLAMSLLETIFNESGDPGRMKFLLSEDPAIATARADPTAKKGRPEKIKQRLLGFAGTGWRTQQTFSEMRWMIHPAICISCPRIQLE